MSDASPGPEPLVIRSLEFLGGMATAIGWRPEPTLPEVAFAGRSNVGKSSLLNRLVHRKKFARVSNTPGRTREINFFKVNDTFVLVDLPGYGYAKISKEKKAEWRPLIEGYLRTSPQLRGIVQLLDARHDPDERRPRHARLPERDRRADDRRAHEDRQAVDGPACARASPRSPRVSRLDADQVIAFSAVTGEGRNELAEAVESLLAQPSWKARAS